MDSLTLFEGEELRSGMYAVAARKKVAGNDTLTVTEFTLAPGEEVPPHFHTDGNDIFYCLEGEVNVQSIDSETGEVQRELILRVGQAAKVEPPTVHRTYNPHPARCRFLLIQQFGHRDFIRFDRSATKHAR